MASHVFYQLKSNLDQMSFAVRVVMNTEQEAYNITVHNLLLAFDILRNPSLLSYFEIVPCVVIG